MSNANADEKFVDSVIAYAMERYETGGDVIVECFGTADILARFSCLGDVKEYLDFRHAEFPRGANGKTAPLLCRKLANSIEDFGIRITSEGAVPKGGF